MFEEKQQRTELDLMGEFGLIDHLTQDVKIYHPEQTLKGIGDDAAVLAYEKDKKLLVTTDILVEGVHFDLTYTPLKHLGYKACAVNISDIAAMNGTPKQLTVSIAISNRFSVEALEELYVGMKLACDRYKVDLVGGDTTSSKSGLFISITALGEAKQEDITYRNGAKEHDLICVSGDLGAAYMGLLVLEREKQVFLANPNMQPELQGNDYIIERILKPEPRTDIVQMLKDYDIKPTAMIDISDGLASEIMHICKDSNVGCCIYEDKIPIDPATSMTAETFDIQPTVAAMNGGEDYELLFTIDQKDYDKIKDLGHVSIIGHITEANLGMFLMPRNGSPVPIQAQGWDSFR